MPELTQHYSEDFEENDEGWWVPKCACGWVYAGVVPSAEDAADALMDHAYWAGQLDEKRRSEQWSS